MKTLAEYHDEYAAKRAADLNVEQLNGLRANSFIDVAAGRWVEVSRTETGEIIDRVWLPKYDLKKL